MILLDTSGILVALFDDQRHHEEWGLTTASLFVLAEKHGCRRVLTLRKAVFPQRFRILPT